MPKHIDLRETRRRDELRAEQRSSALSFAINIAVALPGCVYALVQLIQLVLR